MAIPKNAVLISQNTFNQRNNDVQQYADAKDYLNLYPKVGIETGYNEALINSDFKYSIGQEASATFSLIDKDTKHVVYYMASSPTGRTSIFKAYRYNLTDNFIFEPEPISLTFQTNDEEIAYFMNVGTEFIVAKMKTKQAPIVGTRTIIIKTGGSSLSTDWTLGYDISPIYGTKGYENFALVNIGGVDYILKFHGTHEETLEVYNTSLQLLRSHNLFSHTRDVDYTDRTGQGRYGIGAIAFAYNSHGQAPGFTWNPVSESFHIRHAGHTVGTTAAGHRIGYSHSMVVSWKIPASWITSGQGTLTNLIPIKSDGFRYRMFHDDTWGKPTGGMYMGDSGGCTTTVTDEYSGDIHATFRGTWGTYTVASAQIISLSNKQPVVSYHSNVWDNVKLSFGMNVPDGSPFAKGFDINNTFMLGDKIFLHGRSSTKGTVAMQVQFSRTQFQSIAGTNDTLFFVPGSIKERPFMGGPVPRDYFGSRMTTIVRSGSGKTYFSLNGDPIMEAYLDGSGNMAWKSTGVVFPAIPATVGGVSTASAGAHTWNGNAANPVFYACIKTPTYFRMIRYANGVWTIESGDIGVAQIDHGNASRGDTAYNGSVLIENSMLSESGRIYTAFQYVYTGNSGSLSVIYNTNDKSFTVNTMLNQFNSKTVAGAMYQYAGAHDTFGSCYGWNEIFGYYAIRAPINYSSFRFISSKDATGAGAAMTEQQWRDNSLGYRYESVVSASSSVGLVAYLAEYPIFIGGYLTKIPQVSVNLQPQRDNYIYAVKGDGSRDAVEIVVQDKLLSNTFNRICLAKVTTSADKITDSVVYSIDGTGLPDQKERAGSVLVTNGKTPYWGSGAEIGNILSNTPNALMTELRILLQRANAL